MSTGLLISKDLMFISQVTGTARAQGLTVQTVMDATMAAQRCQSAEIGCVFVDLGNNGVDLAPLFASFNAHPETPRPKVLAFGSHVAVDMLEAARAAGCASRTRRAQIALCFVGAVAHPPPRSSATSPETGSAGSLTCFG